MGFDYTLTIDGEVVKCEIRWPPTGQAVPLDWIPPQQNDAVPEHPNLIAVVTRDGRKVSPPYYLQCIVTDALPIQEQFADEELVRLYREARRQG